MRQDTIGQVFEDEINAAAKIIADISTGLYRSPANAIKELVSNAFDAGATEVVITTGYPDFRVLTCYDDGEGISVDDFREVMKYIGGSLKRGTGDTGAYGRPIIGKIGIGILAIAQIKERFGVVSSRGDGTRFEAEIDLAPFQKVGAARASLGRGTIGKYRLTVLPEEAKKHYTIITTDEVKAGFRKTLADRFGFATQRKELQLDTFRQFIDALATKRLQDLNEYNQMLWELSVLTPCPYFEDGPVQNWGGWDTIKQQLEGYKFHLIVDGYELRKPVVLPNDPEIRSVPEDYKVYEFSYDEIVDDKRLHFLGYVYHQRKQIYPPEIQGILIRIRNVGIGAYDKSFLGYPMSVGPMLRGMSGEIYILDGLEDALNIDRNSFRETDEHYLALKTKLFQVLGEPKKAGITKDIRERSSARMERQRQLQTLENYQGLCTKLGKAVKRTLRVTISEEQSDFPISLNLKTGTVTIYQGHRLFPRSPKERLGIFRFLLAYEFARSTVSNPEQQRATLYQLLRRL
jgi:hypothetical protein